MNLFEAILEDAVELTDAERFTIQEASRELARRRELYVAADRGELRVEELVDAEGAD